MTKGASILHLSSFNNLFLYVDFRVLLAALLTIALNSSIVISFVVSRSVLVVQCNYLKIHHLVYNVVSLPIFLSLIICVI